MEPTLSGVGYHIVRLVEALSKSRQPGDELLGLFLCGRRSHWRRACERFAKCSEMGLRPIPWPRSNYSTVNRLKNSFVFPLAAKSMGLDVFHGPAHLLPATWDVPSVVTIHDLAFLRVQMYSPSFQTALQSAVSDSVRRASAVIALSRATATDIADGLGRTAGVTVVHGAGNYATTDGRIVQSSDLARLQALGVRGDYLLYVGDFNPRKNLAYLLDVFAALRRRLSTSFQLVLAGNSGSVRSELLSRAVAIGVPDGDVVLPGRVSDADLALLYRHAKAFTLLSLAEGFTLVTLEAMSYGVPVVASRTPAIAEGTGDAALLVELDDAASAAQAIAGLLEDPGRLQALSLAGDQRYRTFTWEAAAAQTWDVYRSAASTAAAPAPAEGPRRAR